jgi:hypothetical protein
VKIAIPAAVALAIASMQLPAQDNPLARPSAPTPEQVSGRWNGVNLERRSACANPQNDGTRGTYAQFDVVAEANGNLFITQSGITGLNCTYTTRYQAERRSLALQGSYSCTDGKQGTITGGRLEVHAPSMDLRLAIRLTAGETCAIDSILSMARFAD